MPILQSRTFRTLISLVVAGLAFPLGMSIPIAAQWPLYEALRTTAAIIFGVMGAWLAILYPRSLEKLIDRSTAQGESEHRKFSKILTPLILSTVVLIVVLVFGITREIIKQLPFLFPYFDILRGMSFSLLVFLTLIQVWTLLLTLVPTELSREELAGLEARRNLLDHLQSRVQKRHSHG